MRIAFDHQVFLLQEYGGISRAICSLAQHLNQISGVKARIIAPLHFNRHLSAMPRGVACGLRIPRVPKTFRAVAGLSGTLAHLAMARLKPEIFHETYFAARSVAPKGAVRVLTVYDMVHEKFAEMFDNPVGTTEPKRIAVARADHVLCISESTRCDLIEIFGVPEHKVSVTYLGYDLFGPMPVPAGATAVRSPMLLYVGSRGGYKNFGGLLRAYAETRHLREHFRLCCFGGGRFSTAEQAEIASLGLGAAQVYQVGGGDDVLAGLYAEATAFVYPSLYEGFGIPPLEAMSRDCPVICSRTSSIPEVVGDAGVYFDPVDVDSIADAIVRVVESADLRRCLVESGRRRCQSFSWQRCAEDTFEIYRRLT